MSKKSVGVIGARSMVGQYVIDRLVASGYNVYAFSRNALNHPIQEGVRWCVLGDASIAESTSDLSAWICLCPIWMVAEHFDLLRRSKAHRIVALSSTSRFTKTADAGSVDASENALAQRLGDGEHVLRQWAEQNDIEWVILRPTLIYDLLRDKNLSQIAAFIRRYGFFPLFGNATGRRQPVHAFEVADAICDAMRATQASNRAYNITGGETISYRVMVEKIFKSLGRVPRFVRVPMIGFEAAICVASVFPKYRHLSSAMVQRMSQDMVFDSTDATRDFGYSPGKFLSTTHHIRHSSELSNQ